MFHPGDIVGDKYVVKNFIAMGGMAEVYLAMDERQAHVAIKRLAPEKLKQEYVAKRFELEANLLLRLSHPGIVKLHEIVLERGEMLLVLEHVPGKDLSIIKTSILSRSLVERAAIVLAIAEPILDTLRYIHGLRDDHGAPLNIVHGDISFSNVMVSPCGEIKILDFGAASARGWESKSSEFLLGNARFMAPEHIRGEIDHRSDLYSLSVILAELLFGSPTISEADFLKLGQENLLGLGNVIKKGLEEDPSRRFFNASEYLSEIRRLKSQPDLGGGDELLKAIMGEHIRQPRKRSSINAFLRSFLFLGMITVLPITLIFFILPIIQERSVDPVRFRKNPPARFFKSNDKKAPDSIDETNKKTGKLVLSIKPWANVYLGGEFLGATPMKALELPAGDYIVHLKNPELGKNALRKVRVENGKSTKLAHVF